MESVKRTREEKEWTMKRMIKGYSGGNQEKKRKKNRKENKGHSGDGGIKMNRDKEKNRRIWRKERMMNKKKEEGL